MPMLRVLLQQGEREALRVLAEYERRDPRTQAAMLIRRGLVASGMLPPDESLALSKQVQSDKALQESSSASAN